MNMLKFFQDHRIEYYTEGVKECVPGWIQIHCPFCKSGSGPHLGFNLRSNFFHCYRCGWHSIESVIMAITNCSLKIARDTKYKYDKEGYEISTMQQSTNLKKTEIKWPEGTIDCQEKHKKYLSIRGFSQPKTLIERWGLKSTLHLGNYKNRIIIPIYLNNQIISYQGRDITGKSPARYKFCPKEDEVIPHRNTLYGYDYTNFFQPLIIVEGIFDVWKLDHGFNVVSTFGTNFSLSQVRQMAQFQKVFILFDNDEPGIAAAERLKAILSNLTECHTVYLQREKDPGSLSEYDAADVYNSIMSRNLDKFFVD